MSLVMAGCDRQPSVDKKNITIDSSVLSEKPSVKEFHTPEQRQALFGDLHLHSSWSMDGYIFGNTNDPRDAYRFALGEEVPIAGGVGHHKLKVPLDFAAVTDHAETFGYAERCLFNAESENYGSEACRLLREKDLGIYFKGFKKLAMNPPQHLEDICGDNQTCRESAKGPWQEMQRIAEEFYQPGKFTTFNAYEFTGNLADGGMLHRNVIFANHSVPQEALSAFDLHTSRELWEWLEASCTGDCDVITIPHNSNLAWGKTFSLQNVDGSDWTEADYRRREKLDRLVEIYQAKGNSECHTGVGTSDEFCNFEVLLKPCKEWQKDGEETACVRYNSFVRNGLKTGLQLEEKLGFNPYKYGIIASTDSHNGNPGGTQEDEYPGHHASIESTIEKRLRGGHKAKEGRGAVNYNPGGLAGVWAEENTREAIFAALKRKETFGTSGNRIRLRMFAGWDYADDLHTQANRVNLAYAGGVPMGGDLAGNPTTLGNTAPKLMVLASRDPHGAPLQRLQIIKGWRDAWGETHETTYDIACSDGLSPDPETHRCASNGATVDLSDCSVSTDKGAAELTMVWRDPDFDPDQRVFYYARALENPSCRWSTHDQIASGGQITPITPVPETIQERAWGSPVWYTPEPQTPKSPADRQAYFGDLHIHSSLSFDAFVGGNRKTPDDAYRFAKGEILTVAGKPLTLKRPLDFAAVTDHAEYLAETYSLQIPGARGYHSEVAKKLRGLATPAAMREVFVEMQKKQRAVGKPKHLPFYPGPETTADAWQMVLDAAETHYQPGRFTTLSAFEWSAAPGGANLHRNVIFRDMTVPKVPTSYIENNREEDLWRWMAQAESDGASVLAIPHNSNGSKGLMFADRDSSGRPLTRKYAEQRQRFEPLIEIHQVKANSEVHPAFWNNDEFAAFENGNSMQQFSGRVAQENNYVRYGLKAGLMYEQQLGINPFKYGIIAATDTHNSTAGNTEEDNWDNGSHGIIDGNAESRAVETVDGWITALDTNPGGLTGVWADANERGPIWGALKRRETFGTSGTRIRVRMFAGWNYPDNLHNRPGAIEAAYKEGVAMGSDLKPSDDGRPPKLFVWATRDPDSAPLQRVQIIKGWLDQKGDMQESIYDVACADGLTPDPLTHRCPVNGAGVNLNDCSFDTEKGAAELSAVWQDPDFNPALKSFYYARVLENPTCRWSSWDAIRMGKRPSENAPVTLQERAWGSPIWYSPKS